MATIRDVARLAGVSISTVSLTLNDPERVSHDTRKKVLEAADNIGYSADPVAQTLKSGRSRLIGVVAPDINNPFFGDLLHEVERHADREGYMVMVANTGGAIQREKAVLDHMVRQRVAGIMISPCGLEDDPADHIATLSVPCVLFDHKPAGVAHDFIGSDNELAAAMLTRHLLELGHTDICMLAGSTGVYTATRRTNGFVDTMRVAGHEVPSERIVDADYSGSRAYEITLRLLVGDNRPTAIVAASNVVALGALQAMNDMGVACPDDVSLVGIDDVPWSGVIQPRITSAVQQIDMMARGASEMLMRRISAGEGTDPPPMDRILAPRFVPGTSTVAPRASARV